MGQVVRFPHTDGASARDLASHKADKTSKVIGFSASRAKRTMLVQRPGGIPRSRHVLTVGSGKDSAAATAPVPPKASMQSPAERIPQNIVRTVRTCQGFAGRETTLPGVRAEIRDMIDPPSVIGSRLKALREAVGCKTQVAFAKSIGVEKNTYNPWEKGLRPLTFEGALLIRKRYRVPLDYLFFGEAVDELPAGILTKIQQAA